MHCMQVQTNMPEFVFQLEESSALPLSLWRLDVRGVSILPSWLHAQQLHI